MSDIDPIYILVPLNQITADEQHIVINGAKYDISEKLRHHAALLNAYLGFDARDATLNILTVIDVAHEIENINVRTSHVEQNFRAFDKLDKLLSDQDISHPSRRLSFDSLETEAILARLEDLKQLEEATSLAGGVSGRTPEVGNIR